MMSLNKYAKSLFSEVQCSYYNYHELHSLKKDSSSSSTSFIFTYSTLGFSLPDCKLKYHLISVLVVHFYSHAWKLFSISILIHIFSILIMYKAQWYYWWQCFVRCSTCQFSFIFLNAWQRLQLHRAYNLVSHYLNEWSNFHGKIHLKLNIEHSDNAFTDLRRD